jgi:hypothetical protein
MISLLCLASPGNDVRSEKRFDEIVLSLVNERNWKGPLEMLVSRIFISTAVTLLVLVLWRPANAETTLGRWCDRMIPLMPQHNAIITIRLNSDGLAEGHIAFGDRSELTRSLREVSGDMFEIVDSRSGDKYRIVAASGDLQLLDNDGLIRIARRLENKPTQGECIL